LPPFPQWSDAPFPIVQYADEPSWSCKLMRISWSS
jgi:hypothetical protein